MGSILFQTTRQIPGNSKENIEGWGWGCRATKSDSKEFKVMKEHYVRIWKLHHKNHYFVQRIYAKYLNTTQSWPFCTLKLLESGRINTCIHTHMHGYHIWQECTVVPVAYRCLFCVHTEAIYFLISLSHSLFPPPCAPFLHPIVSLLLSCLTHSHVYTHMSMRDRQRHRVKYIHSQIHTVDSTYNICPFCFYSLLLISLYHSNFCWKTSDWKIRLC